MSHALIFPGQGSQHVGMSAELIQEYSIVKDTFQEASDAVGIDLLSLASDGPEDELNQTQNTQPVLLTASVATARLLKSLLELDISILAGHSLGEYSALVVADVLPLDEAVKLVHERGKLMQGAVQPGEGAMAAILGLDDEKITELCAGNTGEEIVSAANFNSPGQVVIAGHTQAVNSVVEKAKEAGAKRSVLLPVSVPSHCMLMKQAADHFSEHLNACSLNSANTPVVQNVDAEARTDLDEIKTALIQQLYSPVLWTRSVQNIASSGVQNLIECGPGKVLTGLVKRIDRSLNCLPVNDATSLGKALEQLSQ